MLCQKKPFISLTEHGHFRKQCMKGNLLIHTEPEYGVFTPGDKARSTFQVCVPVNPDNAYPMGAQQIPNRIRIRFFSPLHIKRYAPVPHEKSPFLLFSAMPLLKVLPVY